MNQMESALKLNYRMHEGIMATRSQILDTDFAEETAKSTDVQIVKQTSISVRAQSSESRCWCCWVQMKHFNFRVNRIMHIQEVTK